MALLSALLRRSQEQIAPASCASDLAHPSFVDVLADVLKSPPQLGYSPSPNKVQHVRPARASRTNYRAKSATKLVQLNSRVSPELRRAARAAAKRSGKSLSAWVSEAVTLHLGRDRQ